MYYNQQQSINLFLVWCDSHPVCTVNVLHLQQIFAIYKYKYKFSHTYVKRMSNFTIYICSIIVLSFYPSFCFLRLCRTPLFIKHFWWWWLLLQIKEKKLLNWLLSFFWHILKCKKLFNFFMQVFKFFKKLNNYF